MPHFFVCFRSTSIVRSGPAPPTLKVNPETLKCFICGKKSHNNVKTKYRLSEGPRATNIRNSANILKDDVYARIADLDTNERIFAADLYYHNGCFPSYIEKANCVIAKQKKSLDSGTSDPLYITKRGIFKSYVHTIKEIIDQGKGITLSDIRDMINFDSSKTDIKNNEVKLFMD